MNAAEPQRQPLDVLGDSNRREIVRLLGGGDMSVQQLADALPINRPAVSRHLRLLKEAGLVTDRAEGTRNIFHLDPDSLEELQLHLMELWGNATRRFKLAAENIAERHDD